MEIISGGTTGLIKLLENGTHVEKVPWPKPHSPEKAYYYSLSAQDMQREYNAYQKLPLHPHIVNLHPESTPERLVMPYFKKGCLHEYLRSADVPELQRVRFAADAAEGLHVLHCAGIVHGDLSTWNFLVADDLRLCIIDFAGSTFDGVDGSALESVQYSLPRSFKDPSTVRTDLFALGSLIFEIMTSEKPYHDLEDEEVVRRYENQDFPCTQNLRLGSIITGCWRNSYETGQHVHEDVVALMEQTK